MWSDTYVILSHTGVQRLKVIDLGAGHASAGETLCGRIIGMLKTEALLNDLGPAISTDTGRALRGERRLAARQSQASQWNADQADRPR